MISTHPDDFALATINADGIDGAPNSFNDLG